MKTRFAIASVVFFLAIVGIWLSNDDEMRASNGSSLRVQRLHTSVPPGFGALHFSSSDPTKAQRMVRFLWDNTWVLAEEASPGAFTNIVASGRLIRDGEDFVLDGFAEQGISPDKSVWKVGHVKVWLHGKEITKKPPSKHELFQRNQKSGLPAGGKPDPDKAADHITKE